MLSVVVAERPEELVDQLAAELAVPLADPFSPELVSIYSLGMTNWVKQQLSLRLGARRSADGPGGRDGIVANIQTPTPAALRHRAIRSYRVAVGSEPTLDSWRRDQLVWSILEVLADGADVVDPLLAKVAGMAASVSSASAIAKLFDGYNRHRPGMVLAWLQGEDSDPDGRPLVGDLLWQPRLLRKVRDHIQATRGDALSPPEEFGEMLSYLSSGGQLAASGHEKLPERLFLFGESAVPGDIGPLLQALALTRDVQMLLLTPSPEATRRIASETKAAGVVARGLESPTWAFPRSLASGNLASHPLTQNWGQSQTDLALWLGAAGIVPEPAASGAEEAHSSTLLGALQAGIGADRVQPPGPNRRIEDRSVRIHGAAGPTRQVEILRDQILELLNDDPDLKESEIVVICPRLDVYAPLISGVWGATAGRGSQPVPDVVPALRYTIVNQRADVLNPLFGALDELLDLVPGRFTQTQVRSLLSSEPVRRKFDLDDNDLELIDRLADEGQVRWGLTGPQREQWNIDPGYQLNSWDWGVHQLMMGIALGDDLRSARVPGDPSPQRDDRPTSLGPGGVPPLAVGEGSMAAAGRIAGAIAGLKAVYELLGDGTERSVEEWVQRLVGSADLMLAVDRSQGWQRSALDSALDALLQSSSDNSGITSQVNLSFSDFRTLLAPSIRGTVSTASMTHGPILVAPPGVVASVPYKVVCILGLDSDAILPSTSSLDDLTTTSDWIGDTDGRQKARGDLLAAVQAARKQLVITCTSTDVKNNRVVPRAVVLEELVDVIALTLGVSADEVLQPATGVYVTNTRQAFDPINFTSGDPSAVGRGAPVSYDPTALKGATAQRSRVSGPLSQQDYLARKLLVDHRLEGIGAFDNTVELDDLLSFFAKPAEVFLTQTLGLTLARREESAENELPTSLNPLEVSAVGRVLLKAGLRGDPRLRTDSGPDGADPADTVGLDGILEVEGASGLLPPASIARVELARIHGEVKEMLNLAEPLGVIGIAPTPVAVDLRLPSGTRLLGSVDCVNTDRQSGPFGIIFNRPNPKLYVRQVIQLLALAAMDPTQPWTALLITRGKSAGKAPTLEASVVLGSDPDETRQTAVNSLETIVEQYRDGLQCSLPLFSKTSKAKFKGTSIDGPWGAKSDMGEAKERYNLMAFGPLKSGELDEVSIAGFTLESEARRLWEAIDSAVDDVSKEVLTGD